MNCVAEARLGKILSRSFKILFGLGFFIFSIVGTIIAFLSNVTKPSGWYTQREYEDASSAHSFITLFVYCFYFAAVYMFLQFTIPLYGFIAFVSLTVWFCKNIIAATRMAKAYDGQEAVNFLIAKVALLKQVFVEKGYAFQNKAMLKKIFCAMVLGMFITQFFRFNPISWICTLCGFAGFYVWNPVVGTVSDIIGAGSLAASVFALLMF